MAGQDGAAPPARGWEPGPEKPLPSHPHCPSIVGKLFGEGGRGLHLLPRSKRSSSREPSLRGCERRTGVRGTRLGHRSPILGGAGLRMVRAALIPSVVAASPCTPDLPRGCTPWTADAQAGLAGGRCPLAHLRKPSPTTNYFSLLSPVKDCGQHCWEPIGFPHISWGEGKEHPTVRDAAREGAADAAVTRPPAAHILLRGAKRPGPAH